MDGWFFAQFMATGKKTSYLAVWDQNDDGNWADDIVKGDHVQQFQMGGNAGKWAETSFTVIDPVGYDPGSNDFVINDYLAML